MFQLAWKFGAVATAAALLGSCGGGGGDSTTPPAEVIGVFSGFTGDLDWFCSGCGEGGPGGDGVGGAGDGDGGVGAGGDFGQFRNALVVVKFPNGTELGRARTDATGMVTIKPGRAYQGPLCLELQGGGGAQYYEEGKDALVDFPAGKVIRTIVPSINKNIGITPFTEAAFRLLAEGPGGAGASACGVAFTQIQAANNTVRQILNLHFPATLSVDDITRLPFIKSPTIGAGSIGIDPRGRYGLINGAFSKQAAMFNQARPQPTLDAVEQLSADLLDGVLDGMNGSQPAVAAALRTYDPNTLTGELSSALADQSFRFGTDVAKGALPKVVNFANSRYEGYLFDASINAQGQAFDTVSGWVGDNAKNFNIGQAFNKLPNEARVFGVLGNFGHGSLFFKTSTNNSQSNYFVVGDNVNGELGLGNSTPTGGQAVAITLPGVLTHVAGGFAHTVARMADGSVYTWGDNSFGQLGNGGTTASTTPIQISLPRGAIAVAAANTTSYALLDDGSVYAWGSSGGFGLLGDGNKDSVSPAPAPITALSQVVQISARDNDVAVVRKDGSVLHWGSFPADENAFTPGDVTTPYAGGTPLPTALVGLPAGVPIRKILTEQGLFVVLLENGHVYEWGVYFDITAGTILRDLQAQRVLSVPPLRDLMPGGFIGYGVRPFDRLTAMGIDYRGGMWKIRGRVAEEFDPANPTLQRRPQGQAPRPDCASCHIFLSDWPLTPDAPTTTDVCVPPTSIHGGGANGPSLIHAETACEKCHNPNRQPPAALFPNGWLTCVKPDNLPPRTSPIPPDIIANSCTIPVGHVFTPPGTVCATCHNSIIARPLNDPTLNCAQPPSSQLPTIRTTATITTARNDANADIPAGSATTDTTPTLQGTLSTALTAGQTLVVQRNGATATGTLTPNGTVWSFTDAGAPNGTLSYRVRVEAGTGFGAFSGVYAFTVDTVAPTQAANVTGISDDAGTALPDGGFTADSTPTVSGTLSAALAPGETLRLERNGSQITSLTPAGTTWTFTEPAALAAGTYTYRARVIDAATNAGAYGTPRSITVVTALATTSITSIVNDANVTIPPGGSMADTTPTVRGTVGATLPPGHIVRVLRNGASAGTATVTGTNWTFTEPAVVAQGTQDYTARTEAGGVLGTPSGGYAVVVDSLVPTQAADVTLISDDFIGPLANNASTSDATPTISGTLSALLASGETVRVLRGGTEIATLTPTGTTWSFTELTDLTQATYTYQARVVDAANNLGALGATRTVTINAASIPLPGAATTLATVNGIVPSGGAIPISNDTTPTLAGTVQRALLGDEQLRIYRNLVPVAGITFAGTSWTFTTSPALGDGSYSFRAQIEKTADANVFGQTSATVTVPIDNTAPLQTANVTGITGGATAIADNGFTTDTTPAVSGTLSATLGANESLRLTRNGTPVTASVTGTTWTFTEPVALAAGAYTYAARVIDTATNLGPVGTSRSVNVVTNLPTTAISSVTTSPGGVVVASGGSISDTSPTVNGTISATLPAGQSVQVYRGGVSVGAATVTGTTWTFTDAGVATQGLRTYTARTEIGQALGTFSGSYSVTVDTGVPTQTATITSFSSVTPNSTVAGAVPPNNSIADGGNTNDPTPQIRVQLNAAIGGGESLRILRAGVQVTPGLSSCGTNCFFFDHSATVSIPTPLTAPNAAQPIGSTSYTARVEDAAGNLGPVSATFNITFNYFDCNQLRANATFGGTHQTISSASNPSLRCTGCHTTSPVTPVGQGTTAGTFVAVPMTTPTYWCRRP